MKHDELKPPAQYLANLERFMATHSLRQIRLLSRCHQNRIAHWRRTEPGFREREKEILDLRAKLEKTTSNAEREAEVRFPRRFRVFMDLLRKHDDRMAACEEAGTPWSEVKRGLSEHEGFAESYRLWLEEQNVRLEDAQAKKGLNGDSSAARAVLQARDPRYRGKSPGVTAPNEDEGDEAADAFLRRAAMLAPTPVPPSESDDEAEPDA